MEDLDFADAIALQMQRKTFELKITAMSIVLRILILPRTSKVMKGKTDSKTTITVEGKNLEEVDTFTYLGSGVDTTGGTEEDIKARIG